MSRNNIQISRLYKLYEKMPNGMNKRSQLRDLTIRAMHILTHENRNFSPPHSVIQLTPQNKIIIIEKAINKMKKYQPLHFKAATTIQKAIRKSIHRTRPIRDKAATTIQKAFRKSIPRMQLRTQLRYKAERKHRHNNNSNFYYNSDDNIQSAMARELKFMMLYKNWPKRLTGLNTTQNLRKPETSAMNNNARRRARALVRSRSAGLATRLHV